MYYPKQLSEIYNITKQLSEIYNIPKQLSEIYNITSIARKSVAKRSLSFQRFFHSSFRHC